MDKVAQLQDDVLKIGRPFQFRHLFEQFLNHKGKNCDFLAKNSDLSLSLHQYDTFRYGIDRAALDRAMSALIVHGMLSSSAYDTLTRGAASRLDCMGTGDDQIELPGPTAEVTPRTAFNALNAMRWCGRRLGGY